MYAQPIAASAIAARIPPWTVPIGLAWAAVASSSTSASPSENDASRMLNKVAAAGGGASPRSIASIPSSILAIAEPSLDATCRGRRAVPRAVAPAGASL